LSVTEAEQWPGCTQPLRSVQQECLRTFVHGWALLLVFFFTHGGRDSGVSSGEWVAVIGQGSVAGGSWCCESGELLEVHRCACQCWLPHDPGLRMRSSSWAAVSSMRVASTSATRAVAIQYRGVRQTFHRSAYSACSLASSCASSRTSRPAGLWAVSATPSRVACQSPCTAPVRSRLISHSGWSAAMISIADGWACSAARSFARCVVIIGHLEEGRVRGGETTDSARRLTDTDHGSPEDLPEGLPRTVAQELVSRSHRGSRQSPDALRKASAWLPATDLRPSTGQSADYAATPGRPA